MKKVMIIILSLVLVAGGAAGGYFFFMKKQPKETDAPKNATPTVWNPYSTEEHHHIALPEFLISAVNGSYVVKMKVTLDLKDTEAVHKYEGLAEAPEEAAEEAGHGGAEAEAPATPMQTFINSKIGTYMLLVSEDELHHKEKLEEGIQIYLLKELNLGKDFIKHVYIENLIIQ